MTVNQLKIWLIAANLDENFPNKIWIAGIVQNSFAYNGMTNVLGVRRLIQVPGGE